MRAQMLIKPGILKLIDIPVPQIKKNQVLIKIRSSCICNGSDPSILNGDHWHQFPIVFGHEAFGEIVECGASVSEFKLGDRVSWWFTMGAFAEYACVNPKEVAMIKLPESISDDEGPIFELVGAAARAVEVAGIKPGNKVLIVGLGPSGLIMSQWARNLGASKVIGWDLHKMRRETGKILGCDMTYDNSSSGFVEKMLEQTGEIDIVIDAFGDDLLPGMPTLDDAIRVMRKGGKLISYGHPKNRRTVDTFSFQKKGVHMIGPINDIKKIRNYYKKAVEFFNSGKLDLKPLVSGRVSLENVEEGIRRVVEQSDKYLKILVDI